MKVLKEIINHFPKLLPGFYEADKDRIIYRGLNYEPQLLDDIDMLNPDEFVYTFKVAHSLLAPSTWLGAWFGEDDLYLLSEVY